MRIRYTCDHCGGSGRLPPRPCDACGGSGVTLVEHDVSLRVPAGVEDGTRLRFPSPGQGDGRETVAVVRVAAHPYFARTGRNLALKLPVTLAEAALGAVVTVPTLRGAVAVRLPQGTPHGRTLRVRGHGIADAKEPGDLLVTVEIAVPKELSEAQRSALEAFAAATPSPRDHFHAPPRYRADPPQQA